MKIAPALPLLAVVLFTSLTVQADEAPTSEVTVTFESQRPRTSGNSTYTPQEGLTSLNNRLARNAGDGNGWQGLGKAKLKLAAACKAPQTFKGISATGFVWTRTSATFPPTYKATITNVVCE